MLLYETGAHPTVSVSIVPCCALISGISQPKNLAALVVLQYLINAEVDDPRGPSKKIVAWAVEGGIIIAY